MRVFAGASAFAAVRAADGRAFPPLAIAIGNFDGVHRGHQALLDEARARARQRGGPSAVLNFAPGEYTLKIKVTDKKRNETLSPTATFTVL